MGAAALMEMAAVSMEMPSGQFPSQVHSSTTIFPQCSGSQIVPAVDVEDDAEIGDQSPQDDEDKLMFPELVDPCSKQAMADQYMEDITFGARFDDTDDEENNENNNNLVLANYEGYDLPTIEWNREDPQLAAGTVFQTMMDCRNAITTYCLRSKNNYEVIKSEPGSFTVKCPYKRCRWRLHASTMHRSTLVQIKKNEEVHRCPPRGGEPEVKTKLAKTRWLADAILDWLRETPSLGPTALKKKMLEKFDINVPYTRMFYAKEMALDRINGPWNESFQLLYTFKAEVEMASPRSVVAIDKHTVPYKLKSGKVMQKECFRRAFVCFKACWKDFLDGCRPYLAVDATALHDRFKGQLVSTTAVDGNNWMFHVAYGVLEVESEESWTWFLQNLRDLIGHPPGLTIHTNACKVNPAFGMKDQAGAANAEENEAAIQQEEIEAAIQQEEIEAAIQHEEIEAAIQPMEIEATIQHEEIEAAIQHEEIEPMDRELLEPMDREQREQMDRELLELMDREQKEEMEREYLDFMMGQLRDNFEEQVADEKAQASQKKKKKNKKEGKRKVDTGNIPGRVTRNLLMMKNTKTAAVPTVVIDGKIVEAITYNIASMVQIQHSMSEPVDVSLLLPSSDPLLMKDTKTAAVPWSSMPRTLKPSPTTSLRRRRSSLQCRSLLMSHFRCRECESMPRRLKPSSTTAAKPPIQPSADPSLMKYTKIAGCRQWSSMPRTLKPSPTTSLRRRMAQMTTPQPAVVPALLAHRCAAVFDAAN
ncbi:hypothetical protein QYE76_000130 [Lolium multiflorum]|uniref:Transposase MuDR plant domain-containing protein n=1 Tax=Lolium multiflorum TaxID=4521 RepID=A0AAD8VVP3_LOLMU|nr:hypothetical protein QYE76_000130 [Lolium multiflorum]